jgi:hypothetical protein
MKTEVLWKCNICFGLVSAKTKSEARARFKRNEGLKRIPVGAKVEKVK